MSNMESYKGTRDFLPKEWAVLNYIFNNWRKVSEVYGFSEYEAPIIEPVELFTKKSGEEIKEQVFWFTDKGGRDVALRPELTPQLARYVVQYGKELKKPLKWYSIPRLFRYEQPQKGRGREFFQYNADIIGSTLNGTIELINMVIDLIKAVKLTEFKIRINDRQIVNQLITKFNIKKEKEFYSLLDKKYKLSETEFSKELKKIVKSAELEEVLSLKDEKCLAKLKKIVDTKRVEEVIKDIDKKYIEFDISIVRGLAYYTGIVFEGYDNKWGVRAICGGGEYDNLISDFGGEKVPCVGVGMGDMAISEVLNMFKLIPEFKKEGYYIATIGNVWNEAMELAKKLREKGTKVFLNISDNNISKQLSYADEYEKVIIVGERDLKEGNITIKDMKTGKEEKKEINKI
ncbi:MAG TPA: histidine--tRNA ligase [Candidatus Nanoarchaeia archaeon]|nr:histidine--tRNA ligase [Candidatus Nanoarchaeia archaeon]